MPTVPAESIPAIALECETVKELQTKTGMGEDAARQIMAVTKMTSEEFVDYQRSRLQSLADKLARKAESEVDSLTPMQTVISLGIVTDKANQAPKAVNQSLHLHIKGDANSALSAILGPAAKLVFPVKPVEHSKEPNYLPPGKPGPIIETTVAEA